MMLHTGVVQGTSDGKVLKSYETEGQQHVQLPYN